jgi:predicted metalloprotease with PDZ domain
MLAHLPLVLAAALAARESAAVEYRFELERDAAEQPVLELRARLPGDADGETELGLNLGWGGTDAAQCDLRLTAVREVGGAELAPLAAAPGRWTVRHEPGARLVVEAVLAATPHQDDASPRVHYRPILNARVLHLIGELCLIAPAGLDDALERPVRLEWIGFDAFGWEVASSLGRGDGVRELTLPLSRLRASLFVAGEFELFEFPVRGGTLLVAAAGEEWGFERSEFAELARQVVELERDFLDDDGAPFHLISLLPVGRADPQQRSLGGTALHQAFAAFSLPDAGFDGPAGQRRAFAELLLHEFFHDWNGLVLRRAAPTEWLYWFSEGFTCFFTRRLALRGGWIDPAAYVEDLDRVLREYADNPARLHDAERVRAEFWSDRDAQLQPYQLGDLIAARVDAAIRAGSGGERCLDDFVRELVREARTRPGRVLEIEREDLFARLEAWTDAGTLADVRASAVDGAPFELPPDTFAPLLEITSEPLAGGGVRQRARLVPGADPAAAQRL